MSLAAKRWKAFLGVLQKGLHPKNWLLAAIYVYQCLVSPLLGPTCRFVPSCSQYAACAIRRYGVIKGCWLALCRILRCHPWHPGGYDPVE